MNSRKKRKFNTKKGISLVVAIALAAVLFLTTTSFISLALLQQKETGIELNTRQAYVSAKSALDMAKEMLAKGEIKLTHDGIYYYVLYYNSAGIIEAKEFSSADLAKSFIEANKDKVIGNSYIKITKNGKDCTVSAFSSENKYSSDPNDKSHGDLSAKFEVTEKVPEGTDVNLRINKGSVNSDTPPPPSGGNRFLLVGRQTNYSLLKGAYNSFYTRNDTIETLKQDYKHEVDGHKENEVLYIPFLNTDTYPLKTQFPLVFTETVKIDSEGKRCTYKVYDDGIYFLGKYSGKNLHANKSDDLYSNNVNDVSLFTNDNVHGADLHCKFIVIKNNMVALESSNTSSILTANYYGEGNQKGVVVYIPEKTISISIYKRDHTRVRTYSYAPGYYWLPNGSDLFSTDMGQPLSSTDSIVKNITTKSVYSSLVDSKHNLKELHSAYESVSESQYPVSILNADGKFQSDSNSSTFSTSERNNKPHTGWDNYSIYCGPSSMPTTQQTGYYDLFCGDTFNYLWYNPYDMNVENGVRMSIHSDNTVLTIGGNAEYGEKAYQLEKSIEIYNKTESNPSSYQKCAEASRVIEGKGNDAEFWVRPYWGESSFTLTVMNDFHVKYPGCSKSGGYLIKAGVYDDIYTETKFSQGINLLSADAENYFKNKEGSTIPSTPSENTSVGWVTDGKINNLDRNASELTQTGKAIKFEANEGNLVTSAEYSAESIDCVFTHTVETNGATLKAKLLSIDASAIKGNALYISTQEGSGDEANKSNCLVTNSAGVTTKHNNGHLLEIKQDMKLYDNSGSSEPWMTLKKGYYYFVTPDSRLNILDRGTWLNGGPPITVYYAENVGIDVVGKESGNDDPKINVNFGQGGYY